MEISNPRAVHRKLDPDDSGSYILPLRIPNLLYNNHRVLAAEDNRPGIRMPGGCYYAVSNCKVTEREQKLAQYCFGGEDHEFGT